MQYDVHTMTSIKLKLLLHLTDQYFSCFDLLKKEDNSYSKTWKLQKNSVNDFLQNRYDIIMLTAAVYYNFQLQLCIHNLILFSGLDLGEILLIYVYH